MLSVVFYHAFPRAVKGGFIGVDVFFVISGYLISTIIFENLRNNTFSFAAFYARRIRRIVPTLLLVLAASNVIGWFWLLPDEYQQLGKHIAAGAGFVSNFVLWSEAGYFDNSVEFKPLVHLWSLGIEEQFYFVWPLLLWAAWRWKVNVLAVICTVAVVSFALSLANIQRDAVGAFYSPQTRFWELACGAILAWLALREQEFPKVATNTLMGRFATVIYGEAQGTHDVKRLADRLSILGLCLLAGGVFAISRRLNYPGAWALIPVLGAVLIISTGPNAWVNRVLLSGQTAVWIGLISFPLYLWHWPLLSFAKIIEGETPSIVFRLVTIALSVVLAWLSYERVERPIRFGQHRTAAVAVLLVFMAIIGASGYYAVLQDGMISRFDTLAPDKMAQIRRIANAWQFSGYPEPENTYTDQKYGFLRLGKGGRSAILFVGDSHLQQYWSTIGGLHKKTSVAAGVAPDVLFATLAFPPKMSPELISDPAIKAVVFSYYWAYRYGSEAVHQAVRCCGTGKSGSAGAYFVPLATGAQMDEMDRQLSRCVSELKSAGKDVYFILDNPFGEEIDPHTLLERNWAGFKFKPLAALGFDVAVQRTEPVRSRILAIAKKFQVNVIDPLAHLCDGASCPVYSAEGELMYKDYDHLSLFASKYKVDYLDDIFK